MTSQENREGRVRWSLINSWRWKGVHLGQGWLPALRGEVPSNKTRFLLCLEILWKNCSECLYFLHKVNFFFLCRKPVYFLPCPKLVMQKASFTTEPLSIKSMGAIKELSSSRREFTETFADWHCSDAELHTCLVTGQAKHSISAKVHFSLPSRLELSWRGKNGIASKWGVARTCNMLPHLQSAHGMALTIQQTWLFFFLFLPSSFHTTTFFVSWTD